VVSANSTSFAGGLSIRNERKIKKCAGFRTFLQFLVGFRAFGECLITDNTSFPHLTPPPLAGEEKEGASGNPEFKIWILD